MLRLRDRYGILLRSKHDNVVSCKKHMHTESGKKKDRQLLSEEREKSSQYHVFFNPASTRAGVNGASRSRTPVASKIALAIAAAMWAALDGSPPPRAGCSGRLTNTISISGTSGGLMTTKLFESKVSIPDQPFR